ncbi:uncharacterized protein [Watersipora subatra]|uniref:uncharacterized protein n=1 Tax=Watersipora subatra TaxID=2589382 RepID=UPI00355BD975
MLQYEVLRENMVIANTNTYSPTKDDRDGLTLKCRNMAHSSIENAYPDIVKQEVTLEPRYIDFDEGHSGERSLTLNPGYDQPLKCGIIGAGVTITWDCNEVCTVRNGGETVIPADSANDGDEQMMSCTGTVPGTGLESKTETLNIKWRSVGATSTNPAGADKKDLGPGATIGAAVGAGVLIIGMVALSGFAIRKRTGTMEGQSASAGAAGKNAQGFVSSL